MRKYYILIILFFCMSHVNAQRQIRLMVMTDADQLPYACMDLSEFKIIDTTQLILIYRLVYVQDAKTEKIRNDNVVLQIGSQWMKCYGTRRYLENSAYTILLHGREKSMPTPEWEEAGNGTIAYELFTDLSQKVLTYFNEMPGWYSKRIKYEEPIPDMNWQIGKQCDSILGYRCYEATGKYGGRVWHAVFTSDISVNAGPWKFNGLPGLILHAEDQEKQYCFDCIKIAVKKEPVYMFRIPTEETTRSKWLRLELAMFQSPYFYFSNNGKTVLSTPNTDLDATWTIPYNPIERE